MEPTFKLAAGPDTDIWKKPPTHDAHNAPSRPHTVAPLANFISATITFTAPYTHQFDQAGILLRLTRPADPSAPRKWIKAGIELFDGAPRLSVVCCDRYSDWSVASLPSAQDEDAVRGGGEPVTLSVERLVGPDGGRCLWVYRLLEGGANKVPLREITWVYGDGGDGTGEGWELEVAAAVARPGREADRGELEATFSNFDVKWEDA